MRITTALRLGLLSFTVSACDEPVGALDGEPLGEGFSEPETPDALPDPETSEFTEPLALVEPADWRPSATDDPLFAERPAQVDCPAAAWGPELGGLEIQTGSCNYFFATQPSLAAIEAGDALEFVVFHDRLDAAEPSEGHVAIILDDEVVWDAHVEIPSAANVLEARVIAERDWPAGTTVGLHLHNHGYNAWTVLEVGVAPRA